MTNRVLLIVILLHVFFTNAQQFNIGDQDGSALTDSRFQDFLTGVRNDIRKYNPTQIEKKPKVPPILILLFYEEVSNTKTNLFQQHCTCVTMRLMTK